MQNTSNFNLNLVEGTDLVNPPVQFNPNFQTIDAAMFANKEASVGTASEVVTGTVHAIIRANQDADVFRFTSTGAWATGDTMTVDGVSVTVHLSDGTAPLDGAYVIGAEVVAVINGTLVTLLTSTKSIDPGVTSFNSRTGAVTPAASDYDASMIDYDNTLSGLTSTDVQSAIDELAGLSPDLTFVGLGVGTTPVSITETTGEYILYVKSASAAFTYVVPAAALTVTAIGLLSGCAFNINTPSGCSVNASTTQFNIVQVYINGVASTGDFTLYVYHK